MSRIPKAEYDRLLAVAEMKALFRATAEELAAARKRVAEADAILGLARTDLARSLPVFPELHDDLGF